MKKITIVADGALRRWMGKQAVRAKSLEEKYADELAKAGPEEKRQIYNCMADEAVRRARMLNHKPSAGALW